MHGKDTAKAKLKVHCIRFGNQLYDMLISKNNTEMASFAQYLRNNVGESEIAKLNTLSENEPSK